MEHKCAHCAKKKERTEKEYKKQKQSKVEYFIKIKQIIGTLTKIIYLANKCYRENINSFIQKMKLML